MLDAKNWAIENYAIDPERVGITGASYGQSVEMYRHLKLRSTAPVRLVLFPSEGHGFISPASRLEYSERLMRWMTHFLKEKRQDLPDIDLPHPELDKQ